MNHTEIVEKLIGPITPIGKSEVDRERLANLKQLCLLVDNLVCSIDAVHYNNQHAYESSVKEAADYANEFLTKTLGITNGR